MLLAGLLLGVWVLRVLNYFVRSLPDLVRLKIFQVYVQILNFWQ